MSALSVLAQLLEPSPEARSGRSFLCGLIGSGVSRSRSPAIHETEAAALGLRLVYRTIDFGLLGLAEGDLGDVLAFARRLGFTGLNVTHPYKQAVMPLLDGISAEAAAIGAVNTIVFDGGGAFGHNTDAAGFRQNLRRALPTAPARRVVQVGAGGAGAATAYAMLDEGTETLVIHDVDPARAETLAARLERRFGPGRALACDNLEAALRQADGLIQTSPVGMVGHPGSPVPPALLRPGLWVADIVYFPARTELLAAAQSAGCRTVGGEGMVVMQAAAAFRLFTGVEPSIGRMLKDFASAEGQDNR